MPVAAGVVGVSDVLTGVAFFPVATQGGGATLRDMPGHLVLLDAETVAVQVVSEMATKDFRHLRSFTVANLPDFRFRLVHGALLWFQGAFEAGEMFRRQMQVLDGGFDIAVAEQPLQNEDIAALLQMVGGEAVAQGVDALAPGQTGFFLAAS